MINSWVQSKVSSRKKNSDLISACLRLRDDLPIAVSGKYLQAHQDDKCRVEDLSPIAKLNVYVDRQAKLLAEKVILKIIPRVTESNHPAALPTSKLMGCNVSIV